MSLEKHSLLKSLKNRQDKNQYRRGSIQLRSVPGQKRTRTSRGSYREELKKYFQKKLKKKNINPAYSGSQKTGRKFTRLAGFSFFLTFLLIFIVFAGTGKLVGNLAGLSFFSVSQITFSGCKLVSEDKIREVSEIIPFQTNLFGLDSSAVEEKILTIPWVAEAQVKKNWPSTIEIAIVENVPVALLHNPLTEEKQLHYVDKKGVPFMAASPGSDIDFPVITGLLDIEDLQLRKTALNEVLIFLKRIGRNHPYLPAQSVSEIHLNLKGEMVVYLTEYPFPIFFGEGDTKRKYSNLIRVLKALYVKQNGRESISKIKYIQMDYLNNKVLVAESGSG